MNFKINEVSNQADLKKWVSFPLQLYKNDPYHIPQILSEELKFFDEKKNPSFQASKTKLLFIESDKGQVLARMAAIIHFAENSVLSKKRARFGWIEFIEDEKVFKLLMDTALDFFRKESVLEVVGPFGFTDLDPEGLLIEGFDQIPTVFGSYNPPYYSKFLEQYGFTKQVDYLEFKISVEKAPRFLDTIMERKSDDFTIRQFKSTREMMSYQNEFWEILEETFQELYGVTPLNEAQKNFYAQHMLKFLQPDFFFVAFDKNNKIAAFFLGLPNLSEGFKKAGGTLFPFGWFHILKNLKKPKVVDLLLAGIRKEHRKSLVLPYLVGHLYHYCIKKGIRFAESNRELETNQAVTQLWKKFSSVQHRKSRIYKLDL